MEKRLDRFSGWQMTAAVKSRPADSGKSCFYVVEPLACRESSLDEPLNPGSRHLFTTAFETSDDAFHAAFSVCRRAIPHAVQLRDSPQSENGKHTGKPE
jgi:hypothetical protein